jgi:hypothetical protein
MGSKKIYTHGTLIRILMTLSQWSSGPCAFVCEVKQRCSIIGWVTKIYYLEILRALEGTLSHWSRLHLQSLAPTALGPRGELWTVLLMCNR